MLKTCRLPASRRCQALSQGFIVPVLLEIEIRPEYCKLTTLLSLILSLSICKMKIMCRILSHKDIELYMKVVFQALGLKDIRYIEIHIITAILWFKHYIMFPYYYYFFT